MNSVTIYTDGSSRGNPGPGGYGTILISGKHHKEIAQGFRLTTNNRMELMSVIAGLEALKKKGLAVNIYSDSKYVVDTVEKGWLKEWLRNGFKKKKNKDLWLRYHEIGKAQHIKFHWIKGHNNHPYNERCDVLAVAAAMQKNLTIDEGYEKEEKNLFDN
ncbi:MAG: ribonuclease HI [Bacteroidia bacterium]